MMNIKESILSNNVVSTGEIKELSRYSVFDKTNITAPNSRATDSVILHSSSIVYLLTEVSNNKCSRQELKCYGRKALVVSTSTQM